MQWFANLIGLLFAETQAWSVGCLVEIHEDKTATRTKARGQAMTVNREQDENESSLREQRVGDN